MSKNNTVAKGDGKHDYAASLQLCDIMTFKELSISGKILKAIREKGYDTPTPIQEKAIPIALQGKDILGIAQTGTGKTAAFAIPIINNLIIAAKEEARIVREQTSCISAEHQNENLASADKEARTGDSLPNGQHNSSRTHSQNKPSSRHKIKALIITPTRELAAQISDCIRDYSKYTNLQHCVIFGGVKQKPQTDKLQRGVDILIATPGRLNDLINQGFVTLDTITHLVLDEADRMLDMGFIADIKWIVSRLPEKRQTLFFSATMPPAIVSLSRSMLDHPVRIEIAPEAPIVETIDQMMYFVDQKDKRNLLIELLKKESDKSVLVFARTKHGADRIAKTLSKAGIESEAIHGDKTQGARQRALTNFKSGKTRVMIATDIVARGLDINNLPMVINYDMPDMAETYVHRIGRTGRAGHKGIALSFCTEEEHNMYRDIQKLTGKPIPAELYSY